MTGWRISSSTIIAPFNFYLFVRSHNERDAVYRFPYPCNLSPLFVSFKKYFNFFFLWLFSKWIVGIKLNFSAQCVQYSYTSVSPLTPARQKCFTSLSYSLYFLFCILWLHRLLILSIFLSFFLIRCTFHHQQMYPATTECKRGHIELEVINVFPFLVLLLSRFYSFGIRFFFLSEHFSISASWIQKCYEYDGPVSMHMNGWWLFCNRKRKNWCDKDGNNYDDDESTSLNSLMQFRPSKINGTHNHSWTGAVRIRIIINQTTQRNRNKKIPTELQNSMG